MKKIYNVPTISVVEVKMDSLLVQYSNDWFICCLQFHQRIIGHFHLHLCLRVRTVHHMQKNIRFTGFFKCRAECVDQLMRKLMNKSDGICKQNTSAGRKIFSSDSRIQCCKELILFQHAGSGHAVKDGGFSCIGVADSAMIGRWPFFRCVLSISRRSATSFS